MPGYGKGYNGDDDPIIPVTTKRRDFIPVGQEDKYVKVGDEWFLKSDIEKLKKAQEKDN